MHLLIEEVDHLLLGEAEGDVADIDPPGLPGDGAPDHRDGGLGSVRHEGGRDLARLLHALVLHRSDVFEPGRGNIPVQRRLASLGGLLPVSTVPRPGPARREARLGLKKRNTDCPHLLLSLSRSLLRLLLLSLSLSRLRDLSLSRLRDFFSFFTLSSPIIWF